MSVAKRLIYVVIDSPTGSTPHVVTIFKANPYLTRMFEENRGEYGSSTLSKRDIERLGLFVPCGARFRMLKYELPTYFDKEGWEPSGPAIFDIDTQQYIASQKKDPQMK